MSDRSSNDPAEVERLRGLIRDIPDFPKAGIVFKDITPILTHSGGLQRVTELMAGRFAADQYDVIVSPEARGFIFGCTLSAHTGKPFVPVRKPGKLPYDTHSLTYELEYGEDTIEMHTDAVHPGQRVLLVDDVLATGGTLRACADLVERAGGVVVGCLFLLELSFLNGREKLKDCIIETLIEE